MKESKCEMFDCVSAFFKAKAFVEEFSEHSSYIDECDVEAFAERMHLPEDYDFERTRSELIKKADDIYIVKSCEYAAILFSENKARRRAELFMDRIGTNEDDIKIYMHANEKSFFDFAVTITRIFKENGKITIRCISIDTFADLFERLKKDMSYA